MKDTINLLFRASNVVSMCSQEPRHYFDAFIHTGEEYAEMGAALRMEERGEDPGKDSALEEAADMMVCALDSVYMVSPFTADALEEALRNSLRKWLQKNSGPYRVNEILDELS
jgi:hypothetical protein